MKKVLLSLTMAAASLLVLANPPKKNNNEKIFIYSASESLKKLYGDVDKLSWSKSKDNLVRADFMLESVKYTAFFDTDGNHVATTTEVNLLQLPAAARKAIKEKLSDCHISALLQYSSDSEVMYYAEILKGDKKAIYKVTPTGTLTKFQ